MYLQIYLSIAMLGTIAGPYLPGTTWVSTAVTTGRCIVILDGSKAESPKCVYDMAADGSFELWPNPPSNYYVSVDEIKGNKAVGGTNGGVSFGTLTRHGACWANKRARICLWK